MPQAPDCRRGREAPGLSRFHGNDRRIEAEDSSSTRSRLRKSNSRRSGPRALPHIALLSDHIALNETYGHSTFPFGERAFLRSRGAPELVSSQPFPLEFSELDCSGCTSSWPIPDWLFCHSPISSSAYYFRAASLVLRAMTDSACAIRACRISSLRHS